MSGQFGTATGITIIKTDNGLVALVGFNDGEVEAVFNTRGKVVAGGGHVRMEKLGFVAEYDEASDRYVYGGSPRIPYGGSPRIPYGGVLTPRVKFKRVGANESYVLYQNSNEFVVGFSANDGQDGYPVRWRFTNTGAMRLPKLSSEPSDKTIGMLVYADGAGWNPGSGEGLYEYTSTGWRKL